jgi:hypothetical protein
LLVIEHLMGCAEKRHLFVCTICFMSLIQFLLGNLLARNINFIFIDAVDVLVIVVLAF